MNRFLALFALVLSMLATTLAIQAYREMPRQVSTGQNKLRMSIQGHRNHKGSPTVILDTFGFANLDIWNRVQPEIARFAHTISFDHGGHWGSEPGPKPRDARQLALELRAALRHAQIDPPYLFVGYSMGGIYSRVFAGMFPNDVAGIVFVDPSMEDFMEWMARKFPDMVRISDANREAQDEWASQWLSVEQARASILPQIPLTLITGMKPQDMLTRRVLPDWLASHRRWLESYPHAQHIVTTNSGHEVILSDPLLVISAVKKMADQIRTGAPAISTSPNQDSLQSCVGQYQAGPETVVKVRQEEHYLTLTAGGGEAMKFDPGAEDHFVHRQSGTKIRFIRDRNSVVTELILYRNGEHRAPRIPDSPNAEEIRIVSVEGVKYRLTITGQGPAVVLVGGAAKWDKVRSAIGPEARLISVDRLNNESGQKNPAPRPVEEQALELHSVLQTLQLPSPCLIVGHSFGGAVAHIYADMFAREVAGLVLVDPFHEDFADWLRTNQPANYDLFRQEFLSKYASDWEGLLQRLRKARPPERMPVALLTAGARALRPDDSLEQKLNAMDFAEATHAIAATHEKWSKSMRRGSHVIVPDAGHEIPSEKPEYIVSAIKELLRSLP